MIESLIFLSLILISLFGTFIIKKIALKRNIVDLPNERSSHTMPTPRGGGLAIVIAWYIGIITFFLIGKIDDSLFYALLSGIFLASVSVLDDIYDLSPKIRLFFQFISAGLALYFLGGINSIDLGFIAIDNGVLLSVFAFLAMVWFINLYNFLDGIDAYASMEGIIVALGIYLLISNSLALVLVFSILGFLYWNWPKAKIFMGDVGSTQIGFILVVLGIYFHNSNEISIWNWLIFTSLFWFDATLTLFRRWRNKERISEAHKKHAYQRLNQYGFSHLKINVLSSLINSFLIIIVLINKYYVELSSFYLLIFIVISLYIMYRKIDKLFPFKSDS